MPRRAGRSVIAITGCSSNDEYFGIIAYWTVFKMVFRLFVQTPDGWEHACSVEAADETEALRDAIALLRPEEREKPYRLTPAALTDAGAPEAPDVLNR